MRYAIEYSPETEDHLIALSTHQRVTVLDEVDRQLTFEPTTETRNRKPMRPNPIAPWELRIGDLRVFYDVLETPEPIIHAVGIKSHNRLFIGGDEVQL